MMSAALCLAACGREEQHIVVNPDQVEGLWQKSGTEEFWRYNDDYTGVTWDVSDSIGEEESNLTFEWQLSGDELTHIFRGAEGNQAVPKVYTITAINKDNMCWEDIYGLRYTLYRREQGQ